MRCEGLCVAAVPKVSRYSLIAAKLMVLDVAALERQQTVRAVAHITCMEKTAGITRFHAEQASVVRGC